ncbi:MAG: methyltransferase domain-containing protein [Candidatus Pacebacteria bacterium]|nr:methyltransferase domain-containing protein [Candidatus Paceibacterota bacterium]MBP9832182.1 methyltransferase domain-containing protein [Candidatus Paceibacterota bacterium]
MATKSFLRREEYKALSKLSIDGAILDVGGSKKSGYHELIQGSHTITTGNINESYGTDVIFNAEDAWPFENASFDGVLFINLLEHLYKYENAVREASRVLKSGGVVVGVVPFMFNVHGSPNDYFRYTRSTLERLFTENGFTHIEVRELGTGAFSVIYHCLLGFVRWNWLATPLIALCRSLDGFIKFLKPDNLLSQKQMPLGYYFEARK